MIVSATKSMIPALKALWVEAFEDPEAYADFFFKHRFRDISTFVYIIDNIPISMAFVFDEELYHNGTYVNAGYIYGVATAKAFQGKGYSTKVLKHIQSIYPTTFLIPATERLFNFYSRNGYKTAFIIKEKNLRIVGNSSLEQCYEPQTRDSKRTFEGETAGNIPSEIQKDSITNLSGIQINKINQSNSSYTFDNISSQEYKTIRDKHFQREGYIRWREASIAYAIAENKFWGGSTLKVSSQDSSHEGIILFRCYNKQLYIKETTLSGQSLYDVALLLMKENNAHECHIRLPWDDSTAPIAFGMLHSSFLIEKGYCNLVLD
jgi:GNAT superfamily N-acetyltransferase